MLSGTSVCSYVHKYESQVNLEGVKREEGRKREGGRNTIFDSLRVGE